MQKFLKPLPIGFHRLWRCWNS